MTRLRAFFIHLIASVFIITFFISFTRFFWYPAPYFEIEGIWKLLGLFSVIGLTLGPFLTLIVFNSGKSGLKFDMICIIFIQLGALFHCGATIYQQRPAFVVFAVDRFITISKLEIDLTKLQHSKLKNATGACPLLVQARLPEDLKVQQDLTFNILSGYERDIEFHPEFYEPYQPDLKQLRSRNIDIQRIETLNVEAKQAIEQFIKKKGGRLEEYLYLPFKGKIKDIVMVLSLTDGLPVGFIGISPWLVDYSAAK